MESAATCGHKKNGSGEAPVQVLTIAGQENYSADSAGTAGAEFEKRQRTLLRLDAERSLRCLRSVGVSNARRRRISSRMPSESSLVLRRLRARSTGSPFFTVTPRMRCLGWLWFVPQFVRGAVCGGSGPGCQEKMPRITGVPHFEFGPIHGEGGSGWGGYGSEGGKAR